MSILKKSLFITALGCLLVFTGYATLNPIQEAKDVIKSHEQYVKAGNLEGILSNTADDVVVLTPGLSLIKGKQAFKEFYAGVLAMGKSEFSHMYDGADLAGDAVVLYGLATGKTTLKDGTVTAMANNFLIVMKRQADGKMKFWRIAFAPSGK